MWLAGLPARFRPPRRERAWAPHVRCGAAVPRCSPRQPEGGRFSLSAVDTRRSSLGAGHETSGREAEAPTARQVVQAYVALCKPRIIELLLITAVPVLFLADRGLPSLLDAAVVVLGGALAAGL